MNLKKAFITATFGLSFAMPQAEAALFNFSYTASSGFLAGTLDGILLGDNNTVVINSILGFATFNGVPGPSLPVVDSILETFSGAAALPVASLDGSLMDFCASTGAHCVGSVFFFDSSGYLGGTPAMFGTPTIFGNGLETYIAANWSLTPAGPVPVPATLPLLAIGGAALVARRRKAA